MVTVQDVKERWEQIQGDDERILFIVGGPKTYPIVVGWRGHLEGDQLYLEHNNDPKHAVVTITKPERVMVID